MGTSKRIGVYICQCGTNIAEKVDCAAVTDFASTLDGVVISRYYKYMCSQPGQNLIIEDIRTLGLDAVVEASCSPKMHEPTFRNAIASAGLNPYMFEMVNIREHCSWITEDPGRATEKAKSLVAGGIRRVTHHEPLQISEQSVLPIGLVVGGGIAGIHAALRIADAGYQVYLVEKEPIIGGRMAQFDKTFPTLDCAGCILTPKTGEAGRHRRIELLASAEVTELNGYVGNFTARVRQKPRFVKLDACTGCGECTRVCPIEVPSDFELGLGNRRAAYRAFPQAIPSAYVIDKRQTCAAKVACPVHCSTQGYLALIAAGRYVDAAELIRETCTLANSMGRICHHPCETACERGKHDTPVAIRALKRFAMEMATKQGPPAAAGAPSAGLYTECAPYQTNSS